MYTRLWSRAVTTTSTNPQMQRHHHNMSIPSRKWPSTSSWKQLHGVTICCWDSHLHSFLSLIPIPVPPPCPYQYSSCSCAMSQMLVLDKPHVAGSAVGSLYSCREIRPGAGETFQLCQLAAEQEPATASVSSSASLCQLKIPMEVGKTRHIRVRNAVKHPEKEENTDLFKQQNKSEMLKSPFPSNFRTSQKRNCSKCLWISQSNMSYWAQNRE